MPYEFNLFAVMMALVSILAIFLFVYPLAYRKKTNLSFYFILLIASALIWSIGYTLDISATDFETMVLLNYFQYIGIVTLPVFFFSFVLYFTRDYSFLEKPLLLLLFFPPLVHYVLLLTNDFTNLYYISETLNTSPPFPRIDLVYGPGFYSNLLYSYILLLGAFYLLIQKYIDTPIHETLIRSQVVIFLIGAAFPITGNILRVTGIISPLRFIDLTPVAFIFAFVLFTYAIFEVGFLDILPIARKHVFEDIHDMLIVLDSSQRIIDFNKSAHRIVFTNRPEMEISHKVFQDIVENLYEFNLRITDSKKIYEGIDAIMEGNVRLVSQDYEFVFSGTKVERVFYNILITPLEQADQIMGTILIIRNVSARREAELMLRQKNQLQEIILQLLSHDLRNHLNVLKGYSELAISSEAEEDIQESLQAIEVKSSAILNTVNEVTNYLKIDKLLAGMPQRINLNQILVETIEVLGPECAIKKVTIDVVLSSRPAYVWGNAVVMKSVVINLLQNAIKFSPPNSTIKVKNTDVVKKSVWQVKIADQGPGISEGLHEEIFKPFVSFGSEKGTGLGLTICKTAIESFAGKIWVENNKPEGAVFIFNLPQIHE
ncbi:MAG: histidine kinase N-terminal 7TM domain-containing protein [Candidatus Hodarchaeales archaeon]|jgi:signal transduction histidine kinase